MHAFEKLMPRTFRAVTVTSQYPSILIGYVVRNHSRAVIGSLFVVNNNLARVVYRDVPQSQKISRNPVDDDNSKPTNPLLKWMSRDRKWENIKVSLESSTATFIFVSSSKMTFQSVYYQRQTWIYRVNKTAISSGRGPALLVKECVQLLNMEL